MSTTLYTYLPADKSLWVNTDDEDLVPIEIPLPEPPPLNEIDGYGLPPEKQFFHRAKPPRRFAELEDLFGDGVMGLPELWAYIEDHQEKYRKEIAWIASQIEKCLYGHWVFINGKPTFIDGWHYKFFNFWKLDEGYAEYRDRDRKFYHFARFCYNEPQCFGMNYVKHRREGATAKASSINYDIVSRAIRKESGIQSMTDTHAKKVYNDHIKEPWKTLPFFLKPIWDGTSNPKGGLNFSEPAAKQSLTKASRTKTFDLRSFIGFRESSPKAYDMTKLIFYHSDEGGKVADIDLELRWSTARECLTIGSKIIGFSIHTSTVGEMSKHGGKQFFKHCSASHYEKRDPETGRTDSGLYNLFIPATEGFEGFVGPYGESVIEKPTEVQFKFLMQKFPENEAYYLKGGSKHFLEVQAEQLRKKNKTKALAEHLRKFPTKWRHCFRSNLSESPFDLVAIEERMDHLRFNNPTKERGDFAWINPQKTLVGWIPYVEGSTPGKFYKSYTPPRLKQSRMIWSEEQGSYVPTNLEFCAGADPFAINSTEDSRRSDGGGAVFWRYDPTVDGPEKEMSEWQSNRFVCTYSYRTDDKKEYCEDMLMMCIYFSCPMYPEINVPLIWEYFEEQGYGGTLVHRFENGHWRKNPGNNTTVAIKTIIFSEYMNYLLHHIKREVHDELLLEIRDIGGPENMTKFDLFTAGGYAIMGTNAIQWQPEQLENQDSVNLEDYLVR